MDNNKDLENEHNVLNGTPNVNNKLGRNLVGAFLILILALLVIGLILAQEILELFRIAMLSGSIFAWTSASGGVLLIGFLIAFPVFLLVQGYIDYRKAAT